MMRFLQLSVHRLLKVIQEDLHYADPDTLKPYFLIGLKPNIDKS